MCGSIDGGVPLDGVNLSKEAILQGIVTSDGTPVEHAYVRLLDATGEFTAEVPTNAAGEFRFFAYAGDWTLRTLAPSALMVDTPVSATMGAIVEIEIAVEPLG